MRFMAVDSPSDNLTFEQALAELERIVHELEDGSIGLEESLARYEKGVGLLKRCYAQLRSAEQKIVQLTGVDDEGQPVSVPFAHAATADGEKGDAKKRRKRSEEEPGLPF